MTQKTKVSQVRKKKSLIKSHSPNEFINLYFLLGLVILRTLLRLFPAIFLIILKGKITF